MKFQYGKIFRRVKNNKVSIEIINYDPSKNMDYYTFINEQGEKGFIQVIVNSQIMLKLLSHYFVERSFNIVDIKLMEDEEDFNNTYKYLIDKCNSNGAYFAQLLSKIDFLYNEDCIEIFKISLKKKDDNNDTIWIDIQSNGIIRIAENKYDEETKLLCLTMDKFYE